MKKSDANFRRTAREDRLRRAREDRLARFEASCKALNGQGYVCRDRTLPPRRAGALGILAAAPFALAVFIGGKFLPGKIFLMTGNFFADAALFVLLLFVSIPAHEGLHALGWAAVRGTFRGLRFGMAGGYDG